MKLFIVGACSKGITVGITHVLDYVILYGINFDQPPSKCR